jgi:hypothetical protein
MVFATIVALSVATPAYSSSSSFTHGQALRQYYHAVGYIKAIGKNAHRTIYSPNHATRTKWVAALHYLIRVRHRAYLTLHPTPVQPTVSAQSWLIGAFECIHSHEGAWNANTGNGYYGGVQFGYAEWQHYGGQYAPRADLASPAEQISAAIAYYHDAGFEPWPNTARMCGLL